MKLVSMVDYVFLCRKDESKDNIRSFWACEKYANFLKQPLKLEMFVPCDDEGNVLLEPVTGNFGNKEMNEQYQKAQEKVLFKGFEFFKKPGRHSRLDTYVFKHHSKGKVPVSFLNSNIEDVVYLDLELTENAIKKLNK